MEVTANVMNFSKQTWHLPDWLVPALMFAIEDYPGDRQVSFRMNIQSAFFISAYVAIGF